MDKFKFFFNIFSLDVEKFLQFLSKLNFKLNIFSFKQHNSFNFKSSKKAISPIVAVSLLLLVVVVAFATFSGWFQGFSSKLLVSAENDDYGSRSNTYIQGLSGDDVYLRSGYSNITINEMVISDVVCSSYSQNSFGKGIHSINASDCLVGLEGAPVEIVLTTNKGVFTKTLIAPIEFTTYNDCAPLDGVSLDHGDSHNFYNSTSVPFGESCSFISRSCDNGTITGDTTFQYALCSVVGQDIDPNAFAFTNQSGVALSNVISSNTLTPSGYDGPLAVTVSGGGSPQISVAGGAWTTSTTMNPGQNLQVRLTSSGSYDTLSTATVTLGSYSTNWGVETATQDITPNAFDFTNQSGVALSSVISSNTLTPSGYDGPLAVSVSGDGSPEISVAGGAWTTSTTMSPGETLQVRLTSAGSYDTLRSATITLGSYSTNWGVETQSSGIDCTSLPGDWIEVPGNAALGTDDFCVMKYEAKATTASEINLFDSSNMYCGDTTDGGGGTRCPTGGSVVVTSKAESKPLTQVYQTEARQLCENLGAGYGLITDAQWVTIARDAEGVSSNWADNTIGSTVASGGGLKRGNVGITDSASYNAISDPVDRSLDTNSKAMFTLSNGEEIWDISGNVWEWTNDTFTTADSSLGQSSGTWYEWTAISGYDYLEPSSSTLNADYGVGRVYADVNAPYPSSDDPVHGFLRGGHWNNGAYAGAFALSLNLGPSLSSNYRGFRCSYEP